MNFYDKSDEEVLRFYKICKEFHTGIENKNLCINGNLVIKDKRLHDLIFSLQIEAFDEMSRRFTRKVS